MIANSQSHTHLQDHPQHPDPQRIGSLELELDQTDHVFTPRREVHSEKVQNKRADAMEASGGRMGLIQLMVQLQLRAIGISTLKFSDIINRQLLKIQDLNSMTKQEITNLSQAVVARVAGTAAEEEKTLQGKANTPRGRKFTRESSALTYAQQNYKVQSQRIPQDKSIKLLCNICSQHCHQFKEEICEHKFCLQCLRRYLRQSIIDGNFIVSCPQENCEQKLSIENIENLLENGQFEVFVHFYRKTIDESNPDNKFCSKADCGDILQKIDSKMNCKSCKSIYCALCLQPDHLSNSCDGAQKDTLEKTFQAYNIKKCPKCSSPIEKEYGCNHIQCHKCKHQFCWICLKKYSIYHYKYYNCFGCPGMQFENESDLCFQRTLKIGLYFFLPFLALLILLCYLSAVPIYICMNLIGKPFIWIHERCQFIEAAIIEKGCHCLLYFDCGEFVNSFLLWILYQPRAIVFAMFISPVRLGAVLLTEIWKFFQ